MLRFLQGSGSRHQAFSAGTAASTRPVSVLHRGRCLWVTSSTFPVFTLQDLNLQTVLVTLETGEGPMSLSGSSLHVVFPSPPSQQRAVQPSSARLAPQCVQSSRGASW